jgi:orotate phosphoribosyltransferase
MDEREVARILLEVKAVTLSPKKPYKFVSGILSPIYCDNRLLMSYPDQRKRIIRGFIDLIEKNKIEFDVIGGIASSGIAHAAWIAERLNKPMIYIRKRTKEHGKENLIEGKLDKGEKVLVIEDLISTGGSAINGVESVRANGGKVDHCLAIFTYEMEKSKEGFKNIDCKLLTLTNFSTLIDEAIRNHYIKEEDKEMVLEWSKNPQEWGRKMGFE